VELDVRLHPNRPLHGVAARLELVGEAQHGMSIEIEVNQGVEQGIHPGTVDEVHPVLRVEGV